LQGLLQLYSDEMKQIDTWKADNIKLSPKNVQRKLYLNGLKVKAGTEKYLTVSVAIPNPTDTGGRYPCVDVCFKVGNYSTHLFLSSLEEFDEFRANLGESASFLIDRTGDLSLAWAKALDIYQTYQKRNISNIYMSDIS